MPRWNQAHSDNLFFAAEKKAQLRAVCFKRCVNRISVLSIIECGLILDEILEILLYARCLCMCVCAILPDGWMHCNEIVNLAQKFNLNIFLKMLCYFPPKHQWLAFDLKCWWWSKTNASSSLKVYQFQQLIRTKSKWVISLILEFLLNYPNSSTSSWVQILKTKPLRSCQAGFMHPSQIVTCLFHKPAEIIPIVFESNYLGIATSFRLGIGLRNKIDCRLIS